MRIGFTGTRQGMTPFQLGQVAELFSKTENLVLHHGDCIGADAQAHERARFYNAVRVVIHPPTNPKQRAFCLGDELRKKYPYLIRNMHIVDETELLIATPSGPEVFRGSGTWQAIRYARKIGRRLIIIDPAPTKG